MGLTAGRINNAIEMTTAAYLGGMPKSRGNCQL
jgi:hypothetical protein